MEIGKTYKIRHSRKGVFCIRVESISDEWVNGVIVSGHSGAMMQYNERSEGDEITIRKTQFTVIKQC